MFKYKHVFTFVLFILLFSSFDTKFNLNIEKSNFLYLLMGIVYDWGTHR